MQPYRQLRKEVVVHDGESEVQPMNHERIIHTRSSLIFASWFGRGPDLFSKPFVNPLALAVGI
jgi:hypothetical protein